MVDEAPVLGSAVVLQWRKWDGSPHWRHDCAYLGSDGWGHWIGQLEGWNCRRPGRDHPVQHRNIILVPPDGDWTMMVNSVPLRIRTYIDLAWDLRWGRDEAGNATVTGIDMDLDVVEATDGRGTFIDDEDEFAEHRERFGYPDAVVASVEARAETLLARVRTGGTPFDDATAAHWFEVEKSLGPQWPGR